MKTKTTIKASLLFLAVCIMGLSLASVTSCGSSGGTNGTEGNEEETGDGTNFEIPPGDTAFYSSAMDTTPVITATTSAASVSATVSRVSSGWESGNPAYEVFNAFQDYQYPRDEGVIDISNIYKLLFEAGNNYDNALNEVVELTTPTTITSPFNFGTETLTYSHASDNAALVSDGDVVYALLTWIWDENPKFSYGVMEGNYNSTTGDVALDMAYLVDYESEGDYCLRTHIEGNETSHTFILKAAKYNTGENAYAISIVGTGISQSESEDDYFLLKIIDNNNLSDYPEGRYFKLPANVDEDNLRALSITGYDLDDIEDPESYADTIDAMTFFELDGSDHATSVDDFTSSDLVLDY